MKPFVRFSIGEWPREVIICLLKVLKCNFGEVDEAMFMMSKGHSNAFSPFCAFKNAIWEKTRR
jgi:hypothetical protein